MAAADQYEAEPAGAEMVETHISEGSHSLAVEAEEKKEVQKKHAQVTGFGKIAHGFEGIMAPALSGLSAKSAANPCKAIWAVLACTAICVAVGFGIGFEQDNNGPDIWPDHQSRPMITRQWRYDNWGALGNPLLIFIVKKGCVNRVDPDNVSKCDDVLSTEALTLAMEIDKFTMEHESEITDSENGEKKTWTYARGCDPLVGSFHKDCNANTVTNFFDRDPANFNAKTRAERYTAIRAPLLGSSNFPAWQKSELMHWQPGYCGADVDQSLAATYGKQPVLGQPEFDAVTGAPIWHACSEAPTSKGVLMTLLMRGQPYTANIGQWERGWLKRFQCLVPDTSFGAAPGATRVGDGSKDDCPQLDHQFHKIASDLDLELAWMSGRSIDDEVERSVNGDIPLLMVAYVTMYILLTVVSKRVMRSFFGGGAIIRGPDGEKSFAGKLKWVALRGGLSGIGIVTCILAILSGFGTSFAINYFTSGYVYGPLVPLSPLVPFLIIAVGVDNLFIIIDSFDSLDEYSNVPEEKARNAIKKCAMTILFTTVTNVVAFLFGLFVPFYAIKAFSLQAAFALTYNFIYQLTFFVAFFGFDNTRQYAGLCCCACCCCGTGCNPKGGCGRCCSVMDEPLMRAIHARFEAAALTDMEEKVATKEKLIGSPGQKVLLYPAIQAVKLEEGQHAADDVAVIPSGASGDVAVVPSKKKTRQSLKLDFRGEYSTLQMMFEGSHESTNRVTAMTKYATCLMNPVVKILIIVGFTLITAVSTYINFFVLVSKFDQRIIVPDDSYVRDLFNLQEQLTPKDTSERFAEILYRVVDYHKPEVQAEMNKHRAQIQGLGGSEDPNSGRPQLNWWYDFTEKILDAGRAPADQKMQHLSPIELLPADCAPTVASQVCAVTDLSQLNTAPLFYSAVKNMINNHAFYGSFIKVDDTNRKVGLTRAMYWRKYMGLDVQRHGRDMLELYDWADEQEGKTSFGQKCDDQGEDEDLCTYRWNKRDLYHPMGIDQSPLNNFAFEPFHLWYIFYDFTMRTLDMVNSNFLSAGIAVFLLTGLFVPAFSGVFWITVMIAMVDMNLLASVQYWYLAGRWFPDWFFFAAPAEGMTPPGVVNMVMAVGLIVDYAAHIIHTYYEAPHDLTYRVAELVAYEQKEGGKKRPLMAFNHPASRQRMVHAMVEMGPNVIAGGFSTFLGTCWLAFSGSEIFRTFFRLMFATIVWGVVFGMVFIPVVISFHVPAAPEPMSEEEIEALKMAESETKEKFARLDAKRLEALNGDAATKPIETKNGSTTASSGDEQVPEADTKPVAAPTSEPNDV